jgi:hypothetical protein
VDEGLVGIHEGGEIPIPSPWSTSSAEAAVPVGIQEQLAKEWDHACNALGGVLARVSSDQIDEFVVDAGPAPCSWIPWQLALGAESSPNDARASALRRLARFASPTTHTTLSGGVRVYGELAQLSENPDPVATAWGAAARMFIRKELLSRDRVPVMYARQALPSEWLAIANDGVAVCHIVSKFDELRVDRLC